MSGVFVFDDWLNSVGLKEETIEKIKTAEIRDSDSLLLLSAYDITALKIVIGESFVKR
jgi:hypothetical protein